MLDTLLDGLRRRDRRALARLLTLASQTDGRADVALDGLPPHPTRVVAITGSAGVGKSTLVGKLIETIRQHGKTVAVLACDPESPLTGGALLGDRFRMPARPDEGVFIRSLAAPGGHGAFTAALDVQIRLLEAFGFDLILIETVGAGQGDTAIRDLVDLLVVLLQPEAGDDLQWEKAGLVEVADVLVIHKADLVGAEKVEAQVLSMLGLGKGPVPPVLRVSSRSGAGLEELLDLLSNHPSRRQAAGNEQDLLRGAQHLLAARFRAARSRHQPALEGLLQRWQNRQIDRTRAGAELLGLLAEETPAP
jgi:LAO/AO transport system ATPase